MRDGNETQGYSGAPDGRATGGGREQGKDGQLRLQGWSRHRRIVILRRRVERSLALTEHDDAGQLRLSFAEIRRRPRGLGIRRSGDLARSTWHLGLRQAQINTKDTRGGGELASGNCRESCATPRLNSSALTCRWHNGHDNSVGRALVILD